MEKIIKSLDELEGFAADFLRGLAPKQDGATIVGLSGDLGSGKTAFVKAVAHTLGVSGTVLSPTFVIAKFYQISGSSWSRLVHVDAYRIDDVSELAALRWAAITADPRNLVFIEWPERIGTLFPDDAPKLTFRFIDETTRAIY